MGETISRDKVPPAPTDVRSHLSRQCPGSSPTASIGEESPVHSSRHAPKSPRRPRKEVKDDCNA